LSDAVYISTISAFLVKRVPVGKVENVLSYYKNWEIYIFLILFHTAVILNGIQTDKIYFSPQISKTIIIMYWITVNQGAGMPYHCVQ